MPRLVSSPPRCRNTTIILFSSILFLGLAYMPLLVKAQGGETELCWIQSSNEAEVKELTTGVVVLRCRDPTLAFNATHRMLLNLCEGGSWIIDPLPPCQPLANDAGCAIEEIGKPWGVVLREEFTTTQGTVYGRYYECQDSNGTHSSSVGLTQCINQTWSPLDHLDCPAPQDCSDLSNFTPDSTPLGNYTGVFTVYPSGRGAQTSIQVWCEEPVENSDQVWTTIMSLPFNSTFDTNYSSNPHLLEGMGNVLQLYTDNTTYFIGERWLWEFSRHPNGSERPLLLQVLMWEFGEKTVGHLTCGGVTIGGPPFYNLTITGKCFGDADDDGLHLYINQPSPVHGLVETARRDLQEHKEKNVTLWTARIRPQHLDIVVSCPLLNVLPYTGPDVVGQWDGFVPLSRAPGDLLTYRCLGEYSRPGGGGPQEGQVHCQQTDIGPQWNGSLALPCQLTCPANYQISLDHTTCYLASSDTSPHGVTSASLMCAGLGGSLAVLVNAGDLPAVLNSSQQYLIAHRASENGTSPPLPADFNCSQPSCMEEGCVSVTSEGQYAVQDCSSSDYHFLCQVPAECPVGWKEQIGLCYLLTNIPAGVAVGRLRWAQEKCEDRGGSLAFPESRDVLAFLAQMAREEEEARTGAPLTTPHTILLGLNDVNSLSNFTMDGFFAPDAEVVAEAGSSEEGRHWRELRVGSASTNYTTSLHPIDISQVTATVAACQLFGPEGCWEAPPEPGHNMIRMWDNNNNTGNIAVYKCQPGYIVGRNGTTTEQWVRCLGVAGGWVPISILDCYLAQVCLPPPYGDGWNVAEGDVGSNLTFSCPTNMSTAAGNTKQTLTCTHTDSIMTYVPNTFQPCDACLGGPWVVNADTDWNATLTWLVGTVVSATCHTHHFIQPNVTNNTLACTSSGWETLYCYPVCPDAPPVPGENMEQMEVMSNEVGTRLTYTCTPGYYLQPLIGEGEDHNQTLVECSPDHTWNVTRSLICLSLCFEGPPRPTPSSNTFSTWDGYNRTVGTQVNYTCAANQTFEDMSEVVVVECEEGGNWSHSNISLSCRTPCPTPGLPSAAPQNASVVGAESPFFIGDSVVYMCPSGMESWNRNTSYTITCSDSGWTNLDSSFGCYNVCLENPPQVPYPGVSDWNHTTRILRTEVTLFCPTNYTFTNFSRSLTFICNEDGNWTESPPELLLCRQACPSLPPPAPANTTLAGPDRDPPYWEGSRVWYQCEAGLSTQYGGDAVSLTCSVNSGWGQLDIQCEPACPLAPFPYDLTSSNMTSAGKWGITYGYWCEYGFYEQTGGVYSLFTTCVEGNWTRTHIPKCIGCQSFVEAAGCIRFDNIMLDVLDNPFWFRDIRYFGGIKVL